jgi:hypothetical protein
MNREACFTSTKVLQAGPGPETYPRKMDLMEFGPRHKKILSMLCKKDFTKLGGYRFASEEADLIRELNRWSQYSHR